MANLNGADINLSFGVEGGASTASGSGKLMYEQVRAIVQKIESDLTKKINANFKISQGALGKLKKQVSGASTIDQIGITETGAENLKKQIQDILNSGHFTINVTGNVNGYAQGGGNLGGGSSGGSGSKSNNLSTSNQNGTTAIPLGRTETTDNSGKVRRTTEAYRELNGVIRSVTTSFDKENNSAQSVTLSTKEIASQTERVSTKYEDLVQKMSTLKSSAAGLMPTNELNMAAKEFENAGKRIVTVRDALREALTSGEQIYSKYSRRKAMTYTDGSETVKIDNNAKAVRALTLYAQEAQSAYEQTRASINQAINDTNNLASTTRKVAELQSNFNKLNPSLYDTNSYNDISSRIQQITSLYTAIQKFNTLSETGKTRFNWQDATGIQEIERYDQALRHLNLLLKETGEGFKSMQIQASSTQELASQVEKLSAKFEGLIQKIATLKSSGTGILPASDLDKAAQNFENIRTNVAALQDALKQSMAGNKNIYSQYNQGAGITYSDGSTSFRVNNDEEALKAIEMYIQRGRLAYDQMSDSINKAINDTNNLASTTRKVVELQSNFNKLNAGSYFPSSYNDIKTRIEQVSSLHEAIKAFNAMPEGRPKAQFNWQDATGNRNIETYAQALRYLSQTANDASESLAAMQRQASAISYREAMQQVNQLRQAYENFLNAPNSQYNSKLYNNPQIMQLFKDYEAVVNRENSNDARLSALKNLKNGYEYAAQGVRELTAATKSLQTQQRTEINSATQVNKVYHEADNYYKKYRSGIQANIKINQQWLNLLDRLRTGQFNGNELGARNELASLVSTTKEANAETMSLWGSVKKLFTDHFGSIAATMSIGMMRNLLRTSYQYVLDIDKAMTELRKVTDLTEARYEEFGHTAARVAKEVGGSISDTISATADFARLGFDIDQSEALAKAALVYKNVGDGIDDISDASESIISTIKAFSDIDASDAMSIVDRFNEVGRYYVAHVTALSKQVTDNYIG